MAESSAQLLAFDRAHLWHPYSRMYDTATAYVVVGAEGVYLQLADGRKLIDGMSSWWAALHGYRHPVLDEALRAQADRMAHVMFGGITHPPAVELGRRLLAIAPPGMNNVFFSDSGSVAVEVSIKMALQYWIAKDNPDKSRLLTIRCGYHGDTFAAMSVCDPVQGMHHLFSKFLPRHIFAQAPACGEALDQAAVDDLERLLQKHQGEIAALILEPVVQGAGGMRVYSADYLKHARRLCDEFGVLLIFDEIATGFGRTGKMFAAEHAAVSPDIMCAGKALSAGYLTLAATLTTEDVARVISAGDPGTFMHGPTYMANPLACAVASANLGLLETGEWKGQVAMIENQLRDELKTCRQSPRVRRVSVKGAIGVVEMHDEVDAADLCQRFVDQGVWLRPFGRLIYLMPPYIIKSDELSRLTAAINEVCVSRSIKVFLGLTTDEHG